MSVTILQAGLSAGFFVMLFYASYPSVRLLFFLFCSAGHVGALLDPVVAVAGFWCHCDRLADGDTACVTCHSAQSVGLARRQNRTAGTNRPFRSIGDLVDLHTCILANQCSWHSAGDGGLQLFLERGAAPVRSNNPRLSG